jgi:hypothetical protein
VKSSAAPAIEIVTPGDKPKVVATFTWSDAKSDWIGPDGTKAKGFRRLPATDFNAALEAWNREHDPCAIRKPDPVACRSPEPP